MRWTNVGLGLVTLALAVTSVSCQSVGRGTGQNRALGERDFIDGEQRDFAEALAHYSQGLMHEFHKDFGLALESYNKAVALDPGNEELYFRLSMALLQERRHEEAIELIQQLAKRNPRSTKAMRWLGLIYRAADDIEGSEKAYLRWIKIAPDDADAYIQLASLYAKAQRQDDAVLLLEGALDKVGSRADALRALADLHLRQANAAKGEAAERPHREAAIRVLEELTGLNPDDPFLLNKLSELYVLNDEFEKAIAFYESMQEQHPENLRVKEKLAESLLAQGKQHKAVEVLKNIAGLQPENVRVHLYLAELYEQMGDHEASRQRFRMAIDADPDDPAGYLRLAVLQLGDNSDASLAVLNEGLARMPGDVAITKTLAHVYFIRKEYAKATEHYARAKRSANNEEAAALRGAFYFNYAISEQQTGNTGKAAELLDEAMDDNIAFMDAYIQFVFRDEEMGDAEGAKAVMENLSGLRPDEPRVYYYLGVLDNYLNDYEQAIASFDKTLELVGDRADDAELLSAQFYFWFAAACERVGNLDRAEELFETCVELNEEYAEAYNYLAYMWADKGIKLERALEYVQKALALEPENGAFIDTLGWIYYRQGKDEAALEQLERAAELVPDDPTLMDHLGDILFRLGGVDQALPKWKSSFVLDPENEKVAEKLAGHGVDLEPLREEAEERAEEQQSGEDAGETETPVVEDAPQGQKGPDALLPSEPDHGEDWPATMEPAGPVIHGVPMDPPEATIPTGPEQVEPELPPVEEHP